MLTATGCKAGTQGLTKFIRRFVASVCFAVVPWHSALAADAACPPLPAALAVLAASWVEQCKNPLCGRVFDTGAKTVSPACASATWQPLIDRIKTTLDAGGTTALGEVHDNPVHHTLRAALLGQTKAVVFEQIRGDKKAALEAFASAKTAGSTVEKAKDLMARVAWDASGWPADLYRPLVEAAMTINARIYAGDATRDAMKALSMGEKGFATPAERARLKLDVPLGPQLEEASLIEIEQAHCGMMPKSAFGGMADAQRYRDAQLSDAVIEAAAAQGHAVLIAGNGHVRKDRGVPWYLGQRRPDKPVLSVMLIEVEDGNTDPLSYVPHDPGGKPVTDFIVFTPPTQRGDPCEKFRKKKAG